MAKRMILSLPDDVHEVLMTFSRLTGVPASTFCTGILQYATEDLRKINEITLEANKNLTSATMSAFADVLDSKEKMFRKEKKRVSRKAESEAAKERRNASFSEAADAQKQPETEVR